MKTKTINYKILVDALPADLRPPLPPSRAYLAETSALYQRVIDTRLLWRVRSIDDAGKHWIEVEFENDNGEIEWHSLAIDEDTFRRIESEPYEVEIEELYNRD